MNNIDPEKDPEEEYVDLTFKKKCPADLHAALRSEAALLRIPLYQYIIQILINRNNRQP